MAAQLAWIYPCQEEERGELSEFFGTGWLLCVAEDGRLCIGPACRENETEEAEAGSVLLNKVEPCSRLSGLQHLLLESGGLSLLSQPCTATPCPFPLVS